MNKIEKIAQQDAKRWAAAEMFYGPGAGNRRKLLNAEIETKMVQSDGYVELFNLAYENLDMNRFAELAVKERKALDRIAKAHKNVRALKSGNINNLSTGVFIVVGAVVVAKKTGYDVVITKKVKDIWQEKKLKKQASQILKLKYAPEAGDDK